MLNQFVKKKITKFYNYSITLKLYNLLTPNGRQFLK